MLGVSQLTSVELNQGWMQACVLLFVMTLEKNKETPLKMWVILHFLPHGLVLFYNLNKNLY